MNPSDSVLKAAIDAYSRELNSVQSGVPTPVAHRAAMSSALSAAFIQANHERYVEYLRCEEDLKQRLLALTVEAVRKEMDPDSSTPYINAIKAVRKLANCQLHSAKLWVDSHRSALEATKDLDEAPHDPS